MPEFIFRHFCLYMQLQGGGVDYSYLLYIYATSIGGITVLKDLLF